MKLINWIYKWNRFPERQLKGTITILLTQKNFLILSEICNKKLIITISDSANQAWEEINTKKVVFSELYYFRGLLNSFPFKIIGFFPKLGMHTSVPLLFEICQSKKYFIDILSYGKLCTDFMSGNSLISAFG